MKKKLLWGMFAVCCILYSLVSYSQIICEGDTLKYLRAYEYIMNDSVPCTENIYVSDTIIDMNRRVMCPSLKDFPEERERIDKMIKVRFFKNFCSPVIRSLFGSKNKDSKTILFFSTIEQNTLCAELICDKIYKDEFRYMHIVTFNPDVYSYLFIFNDDGSIKAAGYVKLHPL